MPRISKRSVDAATPTSKDTYLWDHELKGFGLKTTPAGKKVYFVQYRVGGRKGRTRRVTIGTHGTITPEQARIEARKLLGQVAAGKPTRLRSATPGRQTIRLAHYCSDFWQNMQTQSSNKALQPSTAASMTLPALTLPACITQCGPSPSSRTRVAAAPEPDEGEIDMRAKYGF